MRVIQPYGAGGNPTAILRMYDVVWREGFETMARSMATRNMRNLAVVLFAGEPVLTNFEARKFNLDYCKKEWLWYLGGDRFDDSIEKHAKMWLKLKQADGGFNSNYGQYLFGMPGVNGDSQFAYCLKQLTSDPGTRRASMVLLKQDHLYPDNTDTVCTYAINFTIEDGALHMTVMMRSNDVIFGFTNDAFCFRELYQLMFALVQDQFPHLKQGTYTHFTNSMHVYERHYEMIQQIMLDGLTKYTIIDVPRITADEAAAIVQTRGRDIVGPYTEWLHK